MSRNKRQGGGRSRRHTENTSGAGPRAAAGKCPSCKAAAQPDARFCHACGAPLRGGSAPKQRDPVTIALYSIIAAGIAVAAAGVVYIASENNVVAPPPAPASSSPAARPQQSVDLSSMSPREAADRLFNRIMMAEEQGNKQEVEQFAPMALQAYAGAGNLDADAQYHIGLIHAALGDLDGVRKQVAILKQYTPSHLLGLILEHDAAEKSGNTIAAAKATAAFAEAYAAEIMAGRPEYEAHGNTIANFREKTAGG